LRGIQRCLVLFKMVIHVAFVTFELITCSILSRYLATISRAFWPQNWFAK
jgi:hypothetical protein